MAQLVAGHVYPCVLTREKGKTRYLERVGNRVCSKPACKRVAVATLTYVYADSTAVLGPLAAAPEPHCYDLCQSHTDSLTVPVGWEVVRLKVDAALLTGTDLDYDTSYRDRHPAGTNMPRPQLRLVPPTE